MSEIKKGDRVRITETFFSQGAVRYNYEDNYPGLIGAVGTVLGRREGDGSVRLMLDDRTEGWNELFVPASGVEHVEEATKFKVGDRVRIVRSSYIEHPSRQVGGTGTVEAVLTGEVIEVRVDNDPNGHTWSFWESELEPLVVVEETEWVGDKPAFEVGDLVSIGKDETTHGFTPGTVARVVEVTNDTTLYVTTLPEGTSDSLWWKKGVTAYVNHKPDWSGEEDDVRLVAKAGTEPEPEPEAVTYKEFEAVIADSGIVAAFNRFNITHK